MKDGDQGEIARYQLNQLIEDAGLEYLGIVALLRNLAAELSVEVSPARHWSWNYLHQVVSGKLSISRYLGKAIGRLYEKRKGKPRGLERVVVLAPHGYVESNSILAAQAMLCKRNGCGIRFIRNSPNQKYHSISCRELAKKEERKIWRNEQAKKK